MARSLNKAALIGNLTRDPELRYTPQGTAVCTFGLATNRQWKTDSGDKKEEAEFHRIVSWNKLAELCAQLLSKGRKVYVEGRLQTRTWTGQDEVRRSTTEIVISDMIILDSKRPATQTPDDFDIPASDIEMGTLETDSPAEDARKPKQSKSAAKDVKKAANKKIAENESSKKKLKKDEDEDMPF